MSDYDRLLQTVLREVERKAARVVEHEFAVRRPDEDIPFIGSEFPLTEDPEDRDAICALVIRALCAKTWFEFEAPRWAQPLPLRMADCIALYNQPNLRLWPVGRYGVLLRQMGWRYQNAPPFERYCAQVLMPAPAKRISRRALAAYRP